MKSKIVEIIVFVLLVVCLIIQNVQHRNVYEGDIVTNTYVVIQGDTLWDIAKKYCPYNMDIREYIDNIKERNGIFDSTLHNGQVIELWTIEKPMHRSMS